MNPTLEIQAKLERAGFQKSKHTNTKHFLGYGLLAVSFLSFVLHDTIAFQDDDHDFTVFIVHYFLALCYTGVLLRNGAVGITRSWKKENIATTIILLNLFLISAYALNRVIPVFERSADWFCGFLIVSALTLMSFHYASKLPRWINRIQQLLLGSTILLYIYMTIFVASFYPVGAVGTICLAIGAHIFIPLFLLIACIVLAANQHDAKRYYWIAGGMIATIIAITTYIVRWNTRVAKIQTVSNQSVIHPETELPIWLDIAQTIPNDWLTQRILKSDLVYTISKHRSSDWSFLPNRTSWEESRKHDPLVFLASMKSTCDLSVADRIKILKVISHGRHHANERLWSGENLTTSYIVSDIDIYPDLRLAYTEKYFTVKNNTAKHRWWNDSEEAIYSFQLPEGSVITSLSLWIDGKEEKAILTSKQKAVKAYNTIVGVERHDPSVAHWQEGNTVTVRVFPCTNSAERRFKIGITSPMAEQNGKTFYKSITFNGPDASTANETTRVRFLGTVNDLSLTHTFEKNERGDLMIEQRYDPEFAFEFKSVPVNTNKQFIFDGLQYSISNTTPNYRSVNLKRIYLDINHTWSDNDLKNANDLLRTASVLVYHNGEFIKLTKENWMLTATLRKQNFSLFPFHLLHDAAHSLVVTKGEILSPHLSDFKDSKFATSVENFFSNGKKIYTFNIGTNVSAYIRSLREFRAFEYAQGSFADLGALLKNNHFPVSTENENAITLHDPGLTISKKEIHDSPLVSNAPDHLARLFAYNDILRRVGSNYFKDDFINNDLVDEASKAYVVSPVSSLIVLETQKDYKRFGIEDTDDSLKNASKQSNGAVPEPHEWALIILFLLFAAYLRFSNSLLKTSV